LGTPDLPARHQPAGYHQAACNAAPTSVVVDRLKAPRHARARLRDPGPLAAV